MDEEMMKDIIKNPFYCITVAKIFSEEHPHLVTKDDWIKANSKLIKEQGAEVWLNGLLNVLEGKYV
jgi:hypothetical protein